MEEKKQAEEVKEAKEAVEKPVPEVEVLVQYRGYEANMDEIVKRVKEQYLHKGNEEASIESVQVYIKPEDFAAYYVINDGFVGKIGLF